MGFIGSAWLSTCYAVSGSNVVFSPCRLPNLIASIPVRYCVTVSACFHRILYPTSRANRPEIHRHSGRRVTTTQCTLNCIAALTAAECSAESAAAYTRCRWRSLRWRANSPGEPSASVRAAVVPGWGCWSTAVIQDDPTTPKKTNRSSISPILLSHLVSLAQSAPPQRWGLPVHRYLVGVFRSPFRTTILLCHCS